MVRKRSRKYESDDNDSDSDLDFDVEQPSQPAPKKYSLRERKRTPLLTMDFDYYGLDEEDGEAKKQSSDDEDFEVEADVDGARSYFEPEPDTDPQNSEGLIDFEDIIRADIVVNKNKIDYENLIQKTEIKLTQPKKRGRKPKIKNEIKDEANDSYICEPDLSTLTHLENQDTVETKKEESEVTEEGKETFPAEISFCEGQVGLPNGEGSLENLENGDSQKMGDEADPLVIKNANSIEMVMLKPPPVQEVPEEEPVQEVPEEEKVEDEDDDVIILGEVKQDVIVLDD